VTEQVTVGIDIGTTATKAVAADADGITLARARVPHAIKASHPGELAHDAAEAWWHGPRAALAEIVEQLGDPTLVAAVNVAAMVPSLCAVGDDGIPISDGLLYGDDRGAGGDGEANPSESGELVRFLASLVESHPDAAGYWPAQAVANHALSGIGALDTTTAMTTLPLFDFVGWDEAVAKDAGLDDTSKLPRIVSGADAIGPVSSLPDAILASGTIDALGEQMVAGADHVGDVLVILGATLIVWAVVPEWRELEGVWTVPHTAPGLSLIGGPSNAGGLFMNWVTRLIGRPDTDDRRVARSARVPVFQPYLRGERVPFHDRDRRASLHGLDIGCDRPEIRRAAYEASGFAIRHMLDLAELHPSRIVATGGGTHDAAWIDAIADATTLPVDVVAVPEGAALGTAYLARVTAGLEAPGSDPSRWARHGRRVEPDADWAEDVAARYELYRSLADRTG
jgi:xylulokinase